jgi:hypothetical protein
VVTIVFAFRHHKPNSISSSAIVSR